MNSFFPWTVIPEFLLLKLDSSLRQYIPPQFPLPLLLLVTPPSLLFLIYILPPFPLQKREGPKRWQWNRKKKQIWRFLPFLTWSWMLQAKLNHSIEPQCKTLQSENYKQLVRNKRDFCKFHTFWLLGLLVSRITLQWFSTVCILESFGDLEKTLRSRLLLKNSGSVNMAWWI